MRPEIELLLKEADWHSKQGRTSLEKGPVGSGVGGSARPGFAVKGQPQERDPHAVWGSDSPRKVAIFISTTSADRRPGHRPSAAGGVAFLGPNGAGKTTTVEILEG